MLFGFVVFLSALLLFQVQLIISKHLLPWFGGTPAVWTTSQMFFQVLLLAGYAYAHGLMRLRRSVVQYRIHLAVLVLATAALAVMAVWSGEPLLAPVAMSENLARNPVVLLIGVLFLGAGLPFFAVATTGPLLQSWHSRHSRSLDTTYRLYALSNVGSFLALFSYPLVVEHYLDLTQQAWVWAVLFAAFAAACGAAARRALRNDPDAALPGMLSGVPSDEDQPTTVAPLRILLWCLLSATSCVAFLATTNQLTQDIAAVPFLWVLPLAIYLLTFIICFDRPQWYSRRWSAVATAVTSVAVLPEFVAHLGLPLQITAHGAFLFSLCMLCHGEIVRLRPGARHLTLFYLLVALGGALGGIFVSLAAPALFPDLWEFQLVMVFVWVVVGLAWFSDDGSPAHAGDRWLFAAIVMVACCLAIRFPVELAGLWYPRWLLAYGWPLTLVTGLLLAAVICRAAWCTSIARSPLWPRTMIGVLVLSFGMAMVSRVQAGEGATLYAARNFYGVVRVVGSVQGPAEVRELVHGTTLHGVQLDVLGRTGAPTAYYSPSSGIAAAATTLVRESAATAGRGVHVGVLGMGAGTMTAFARAGDSVRFYEINPEVIDIATGPYFTFVRHSPSEVTIAEGDARLLLERELRTDGAQQFDLLAIDAFASDSVPVHLITVEAFRLYAAHLRDESSIIAVNVTNRYLELEPVVAANAHAIGLHAIRIDTDGDKPVVQGSSWILLSRDPQVLQHPELTVRGAQPLTGTFVEFTDRYSNLFRVLK